MSQSSFVLEDYRTVHKRETWKNTGNTIAAFLIFTVGLNNYWRFPNACFLNGGGGAFVFPYMIMMILIGRPMYYLDMALGQFSGKGNIHLFRSLGRGWKGIGVSQCILSFFEAVNYSVLLTIAVYYIGNSFREELPWAKCVDEWKGCTTNFSLADPKKNMFLPSEYFLKEKIRRSHKLKVEGIGLPDWQLFLCSLFTWTTVYLTLFKGPTTAGNFCWISLVLPYILLLFLLSKSNGKKGASLGMSEFLKPNWKLLFQPRPWISAMTQCLVSLGIGAGPVSTIASYNYMHCDIGLVSIVVVVIDILTSFMCGFTMFAGIGHLAYEHNVPVQDILSMQGYAVVFIYYEQVIETYGDPRTYALVLFGLLYVLGHGPLCGYTLCLITSIMDIFPKLPVELASFIVCTTCFIFTIPYCTNLQELLHGMIDSFCNLYVLTFIAIMELIAVMYVYGLKFLCWDMEYIRSHSVPLFLRWMWTVVVPFMMVFVYLNAVYESPRSISENMPDSASSYLLGALMLMIAPIPYTIIKCLVQNRKLGKKVFAYIFDSNDWLPLRLRDAESVILFRQVKMAKEKELGLVGTLRKRVYQALINI